MRHCDGSGSWPLLLAGDGESCFQWHKAFYTLSWRLSQWYRPIPAQISGSVMLTKYTESLQGTRQFATFIKNTKYQQLLKCKDIQQLSHSHTHTHTQCPAAAVAIVTSWNQCQVSLVASSAECEGVLESGFCRTRSGAPLISRCCKTCQKPLHSPHLLQQIVLWIVVYHAAFCSV